MSMMSIVEIDKTYVNGKGQDNMQTNVVLEFRSEAVKSRVGVRGGVVVSLRQSCRLIS